MKENPDEHQGATKLSLKRCTVKTADGYSYSRTLALVIADEGENLTACLVTGFTDAAVRPADDADHVSPGFGFVLL